MPLALSRRNLLQSMALCGLSACTFDRGAFPDQDLPGATGAAASTLGPVDESTSVARRLERATFGTTALLRDQVHGFNDLEAWLGDQIGGLSGFDSPDALTFSGSVESLLAGDRQRPTDGSEQGDLRRRCMQTLVGRTVVEAAYGQDQLRQRMVDTLADLLHVSSFQSPELFLLPSYDQLLRDGAFGRFADLLVASARHPAMLVFLDQATSRADRGRTPNENYARELMELHTVGVDGGYDEQDVVELAHVLTGWSIDRATQSFTFRPEWHDLGPFDADGDILGWRPTSSQSGEAAGVAAIEYLARHSATANRIAHLLARRFVSESIAPDDVLVTEAATVYSSHDTALGPVVRHLLTSDRFDQAATLMLRRPLDLVAHMLRVAGGRLDVSEVDRDVRQLSGLLHVLGHLPYAWPAPNGFPFGSAAWSNAGSMISRWNAVITMCNGTEDSRPVAGSADVGSALSLSPSALGAADNAELAMILCGPAHQLY